MPRKIGIFVDGIPYEGEGTLNTNGKPAGVCSLLRKAASGTQNNVYVDVGQFKIPVGYESLASVSALPLVERALMFTQRDPFDGGYGMYVTPAFSSVAHKGSSTTGLTSSTASVIGRTLLLSRTPKPFWAILATSLTSFTAYSQESAAAQATPAFARQVRCCRACVWIAAFLTPSLPTLATG
ncbi:MAG TPA: hypothetical protein VF600_02570 [Abditibacteriaceae bacterium]